MIVDSLLSAGHDVPTAHLSRSDVMSLEEVVDPVEVYTRDMDWIESCQALVAEVSTPSHGVGYEISSALAKRKPVLCLHQEGSRISKMLSGNVTPGFTMRSYRHKEEIPNLIEEFLTPLQD